VGPFSEARSLSRPPLIRTNSQAGAEGMGGVHRGPRSQAAERTEAAEWTGAAESASEKQSCKGYVGCRCEKRHRLGRAMVDSNDEDWQTETDMRSEIKDDSYSACRGEG